MTVPACPQCQAPESQVRDSRPSDIGIRRRRYCPRCDTRWTTYELSVADIENLRKLREEIDRSVQSLRGLLERLPIVPAVPYQAHPSDGWLAAQVTTDEEDQA